ncbi:MAG TPA: T9SS type A sorting domain-containing protein [Flavobacteriales bacterium]|nr:T9SS type A sorting domain-containing protein [Flavobacteriales bacterium]
MSGISHLAPREPQANLYAIGAPYDLCGYPEACVFRYDGQAFHEWEPVNSIPPSDNTNIWNVFDYLGYAYMTGAFPDPLVEGESRFLRWNGSNWEYIPGWGDHTGSIYDIEIHNDTLYVAGQFRQENGAPGNNIALFDGTSWNDMSGGVTVPELPVSASVHTIQWFHDELYVSGQFNEAGGMPLGDGFAKWNGHQWCALPGDFENPVNPINGFLDMAVWHDSLFVCGAFTTVDGEPVRHVAKWIGGDATLNCSPEVGMAEPRSPHSVTIAPNPASTTITLEGLPPDVAVITIRDVVGRTVQRSAGVHTVLDVSSLPSGTYTLEVLNARNVIVSNTRFVK